MTSIKKSHWAAAALAVTLLSSTAAFLVNPPSLQSVAAAAAEQPTPAVPVTIAVVSRHDIVDWQQFSGRLEAVDRVQIRPRVGGAVQQVHFREGSLVKAGDLLFTIDPAPYEAAVAQAEGQVASAQAKLDLAKTEFNRGQRLWNSKAISQSDYDSRLSSVSEAEASLRSAQAQFKSAHLELDYTQVHAPVSGRVGKIDVTVGNLVAAGTASPALTTLVSVDPIYATFKASEDLVSKALSRLPQTDGAIQAIEDIPVEVGTLSDEGTPIRGKLQLVDNQVDAASGTIGVRAVFDNPGGHLIPGQFVRIRMGQPNAENRLLVSERAIGTDQSKKFVLVVDDENKVNYREVVLGDLADGMRVVDSGLADGDKVIVNGLQRVRPGSLVEPQTDDKVASN